MKLILLLLVGVFHLGRATLYRPELQIVAVPNPTLNDVKRTVAPIYLNQHRRSTNTRSELQIVAVPHGSNEEKPALTLDRSKRSAILQSVFNNADPSKSLVTKFLEGSRWVDLDPARCKHNVHVETIGKPHAVYGVPKPITNNNLPHISEHKLPFVEQSHSSHVPHTKYGIPNGQLPVEKKPEPAVEPTKPLLLPVNVVRPIYEVPKPILVSTPSPIQDLEVPQREYGLPNVVSGYILPKPVVPAPAISSLSIEQPHGPQEAYNLPKAVSDIRYQYDLKNPEVVKPSLPLEQPNRESELPRTGYILPKPNLNSFVTHVVEPLLLLEQNKQILPEVHSTYISPQQDSQLLTGPVSEIKYEYDLENSKAVKPLLSLEQPNGDSKLSEVGYILPKPLLPLQNNEVVPEAHSIDILPQQPVVESISEIKYEYDLENSKVVKPEDSKLPEVNPGYLLSKPNRTPFVTHLPEVAREYNLHNSKVVKPLHPLEQPHKEYGFPRIDFGYILPKPEVNKPFVLPIVVPHKEYGVPEQNKQTLPEVHSNSILPQQGSQPFVEPISEIKYEYDLENSKIVKPEESKLPEVNSGDVLSKPNPTPSVTQVPDVSYEYNLHNSKVVKPLQLLEHPHKEYELPRVDLGYILPKPEVHKPFVLPVVVPYKEYGIPEQNKQILPEVHSNSILPQQGSQPFVEPIFEIKYEYDLENSKIVKPEESKLPEVNSGDVSSKPNPTPFVTHVPDVTYDYNLHNSKVVKPLQPLAHFDKEYGLPNVDLGYILPKPDVNKPFVLPLVIPHKEYGVPEQNKVLLKVVKRPVKSN